MVGVDDRPPPPVQEATTSATITVVPTDTLDLTVIEVYGGGPAGRWQADGPTMDVTVLSARIIR